MTLSPANGAQRLPNSRFDNRSAPFAVAARGVPPGWAAAHRPLTGTTTYQSLNVSVPVTVDNTTVDASNARILFALNIGGYMSSSVTGSADAAGGGSTTGGTPGAAPSGAPSAGSSGAPSGSGDTVSDRQLVDNGNLALAAGYVVVSPGARGRDNVTSAGEYYGKAPAAIVDRKAAVRYVRFNTGRIPGNTDWIITSGSSAGGALSALLGASAGSSLYESYLTELGAVDATDAVFASADYCPITDLERADAAYEWMFGSTPVNGQQVDQGISTELTAAFAEYQASLGLQGRNGFGQITADNYDDYPLQTYLPAATTYLTNLSSADRSSYLAEHPWITWSNDQAMFTWASYLEHVGRS